MSRVLKTKGNLITQHYANKGHNGVDLVGAGHTTDTIVAHSEGKVVFVQTGQKNNLRAPSGTNATYGNCVKIKHSNGYCTLYAHLSKVYVSLGQQVSKGQDIGYMGDTGRSSGAHLHFEVRTGDAYSTITNPESYLDADLPGMLTIDNRYINNALVGDWQRLMNQNFKTKLSEDHSFGPSSQKTANKYQLYWKKSQMHNEYVKWVQQRLNMLGFKGKYGEALAEDGYFGENTDWAVHEYQKARNITANGYVGINTVSWLLKDNY